MNKFLELVEKGWEGMEGILEIFEQFGILSYFCLNLRGRFLEI